MNAATAAPAVMPVPATLAPSQAGTSCLQQAIIWRPWIRGYMSKDVSAALILRFEDALDAFLGISFAP